MKNLAIIPARGGSKRIPRKNLKSFLGKPIIEYSIEAALSSGLFDEVMVSTEDVDIGRASIALGAKVPFFRSDKNASDFATLADVVLEVIAWYEKNRTKPENICCILATAPFVTPAKLQTAYDKLINEQFTVVFPAAKFSYPIQRALHVDPESQTISMVYPENLTARSQDLEDYYHDSGQFYWAKVDTLKREKSFITSDTGILELPQIEVQDIDNEDDWIIAEQKYLLMNK
jgi:N-acylneuraminate cytidylyltransferase